MTRVYSGHVRLPAISMVMTEPDRSERRIRWKVAAFDSVAEEGKLRGTITWYIVPIGDSFLGNLADITAACLLALYNE